MKCKKCGKLISEDRLYCGFCGTEVQMVPEYNKIEEELDASMRLLQQETKKGMSKETVISSDSQSKTGNKTSGSGRSHIQSELEQEKRRIKDEIDQFRKDNFTDSSDKEGEKEAFFNKSYNNDSLEDEFRLDKRADTPQQRRIKLIASIAGLSVIILLLLIGIVSFFVIKGNNNSYQVQLKAANSYWESGNYEKAVVSFEKAIQAAKSTEEKLDVNKKFAQMYIANDDMNNAIYYLEAAVDEDSSDAESVRLLVSLYEDKYDTDAIRKLADKAKGEDTKELFEKYLLNQPVFNYKSGTYNELFTVEITSADGEAIYYTLDDTQATQKSIPYSGPIEVKEGKTVIHAITVNGKGYISDEIITTYQVSLDVPPTPVITPDSGKFNEAKKITIRNIPSNCKVYYTLDGTVPTDKSNEYTEAFDMLLGNYVVSAVSINPITGVTSEVVSKVFELSVSGKTAWTEASAKVIERLIIEGKITDASGNLSEGGICRPIAQTEYVLAKNKYYIVRCYKVKGETITDTDWYYAVDVNTGMVYRAIPNGVGQYNLNP